MKKDLDYYMSLPYTIEIVRIPDSQGGGYSARLPEIGRLAIVGDGETIQEAMSDLEEIKRERFAAYLQKGVSIPEPANEEAFSGNFSLRVPPNLHMAASNRAKRDHLSLNQWIKTVLEKELLFRDEFRRHEERDEKILSAIELVLRTQERFAKRIESLEETISERVLAPMATDVNLITATDAVEYVMPYFLYKESIQSLISDVGIEENENKGFESNSD